MGAQFLPMLGYGRQPIKLKGFSGVTSGLATVRIPGGKLIHELCMVTNAIVAEILKVELKRNGNTIVDLTGTQIKFLDDYRKLHVEAGRFNISLSDVWMQSLEGEVISGLNTFVDDDIELNVTLDAAAILTRLSAAPTLAGEAIMSAFNPADPMALWEPRIRFVSLDGGPAGDSTIINNVHEKRDGTEVIRRLHLYGGASDYISNLKVKRDGTEIHDQARDSMRYMLKRRDLAPQDDWYHFDPVAYGFAIEAMNTAHNEKLEFIPTFSTALSDVQAIIETMRKVR